MSSATAVAPSAAVASTASTALATRKKGFYRTRENTLNFRERSGTLIAMCSALTIAVTAGMRRVGGMMSRFGRRIA